MRGISEERLKEIVEDYPPDHRNHRTAKYFIATECQELQEPWIPIDENTPKNRSLLIFVPAAYGCEIGGWVSKLNRWSCHPFVATHYQELPDDPVIPIHKPEPPK